MNTLIRRFNEIQEINKELRIESMRLPQIVVIGSQSSGKSSVLESIVGSDFFPKGKGMVTRCPLRLELLNGSITGSEFEARFNHKKDIITSYGDISKEIKRETDKRTSNIRSISDEELVLEITGSKFPTLTLVDLPGLIHNIENDQPKDLDSRITELMMSYIEPENSIILAVSPANVDLATSEIVKYTKKVDPQGRRTIHVLTKLDIMNEGESANDPLNCDYLRASVAVIGVINRNERDVQRAFSIEEQRSKEEKFFLEKYPDLASKNGTMYLLKVLERVLTQSIEKFIPVFEDAVKNNIRKYQKELKNLNPMEKRDLVSDSIINFCNTYKRMLKGNLDWMGDQIHGGAVISHCLYEKFSEEMAKIHVSPLSEDNIYAVVKNSTGIRDIMFSFEKPFKQLIRKEIPKFRDPCNACIEEVEAKLNNFVDVVLERMEMVAYPRVATAMKTVACEIIKERSEKSRNMIIDYIASEINDVTFTNPYKDILDNIRNYPMVSRNGVNTENTVITPSMLKATINLIGLGLPIESYYPHINMAVAAFGLSSKLKDSYDAGKFNEVINTVNDVIDKGIGLETLKEKISKDLNVNMKKFMSGFKVNAPLNSDKESRNQIQITQAIIIKNIIYLYFEMVRKNIVNYVPKTIQTFLLSQISDEMLRKIQVDMLREKYLDSLIGEECDALRIENLRNDLEKSLVMKEKLQRLKY